MHVLMSYVLVFVVLSVCGVMNRGSFMWFCFMSLFACLSKDGPCNVSRVAVFK